ncbi:TNF receptor-associated factor1b [Sesamum alatum]|uniref:TNF receptor-associated factor1b n=1 Tax=Sesamum alatum TaxID=300844 RepID=A0AAE2CGT4_9LAMI|nr:TNF receptor-associated factor1b [Sesamum alatum]
MAGVAIEESGAGRSFEGISSGQQQQCQAGEALAEWRSSEQVENGSPSTSPPYWDSDDDDDGGPKPSELYGKYTWKIDKFSQINKRELRSNAFEGESDRPFRCLDMSFRGTCTSIVFDKCENKSVGVLLKNERANTRKGLIEDKVRWSKLLCFLAGMDQSSRRRMSREKAESILKGKYLEAEDLPFLLFESRRYVRLVDDVCCCLRRAAIEPLPPKDEKGPQNRTKDGSAGEEFSKDSIERDERRLTELGRRTIEIFVLAHISGGSLACRESSKKQGVAVDKEKKSKKKQGKQKRNNRKGKDKGRDDKNSSIVLDKIEQDSPTTERKDVAADQEMVVEKSDAVEDVSDASDYGVPEILRPDSEDRDASPVNWKTDTSEVHPPTEAIAASVPHKANSRCHKSQKSPSRERNHQSKLMSDTADWATEEHSQPSEAVADARQPNGVSQSYVVGSLSQAASRSLQDGLLNRSERQMGKKKEEETGSLHRNFNAKDAVDMEASGDKAACVTSPPRSPSKSIPLIAPRGLESKSNAARDPLMFRKTPSDSPKQADNSVLLTNSSESAATLKPDPQRFASPKPAEKLSGNQIHVGSEKLPAQEVAFCFHGSMVQTAPGLARSVSAAGRLGPEPTASATQSYVPQSYRNAIIGGPVTGSSSAYSQNHPAGSVVNASHSYSQATALVSSPLFSPHSSDRIDPNPVQPSLSFGMVNHHDILQNGPLWMERHQRASSRNLPGDHGSLVNDMQSLNLYSPMQSDLMSSSIRAPSLYIWRQSHLLQDEFPHLDIINDLLDDEHGLGMVARVNSGYQSFSNGPHNLNRHYSFPGDPSVSSGLGPSISSCRFDRARSYHDDGFQHGQVGPGRTYDTVRDMIPQASRPYVNGQVDGFMPNQWQMAGSDMPYLNVRNMDSDGYPYHLQDYQNLSVGINGYTVFRPSNGL